MQSQPAEQQEPRNLLLAALPDREIQIELKLKDIVGMEVLDRIATEMKRKRVPIFIWTRLSHAMLCTTASSFVISRYFEKHTGSERALVAAILAALTDQQKKTQSIPPV